MTSSIRWGFAAVAFGAAFLFGAGPVACSDADRTTGRRVALAVRVQASPDSARFRNARGWDIEIRKAYIATGAMYFYDGEPLFAGRARRPFEIRAAMAHPGHYAPGATRGEMLASSSVDLLAGAVAGAGRGVTGPFRSATFAFDAPARGPLAGELGSLVAIVEGRAAKDALVRLFRAEIQPADVADASGVTTVVGCPFEAVDVAGDGEIQVTVHLTRWFDQVAFDDVPASADGAPVVLGEGLARNQLVRGIRVGLGYRFSYRPASP